jgi:hypothetical protein
MLYHPLEETPRRPGFAARLLGFITGAFAGFSRRHADTLYLDSLSERELAEFGLRRRDERDYPSFR